MIETLDEAIEKSTQREILKKNGWKIYADKTMLTWSKTQLIEFIRALENNYANVLERHENTIAYIEGTINKNAAEDIKFDEDKKRLQKKARKKEK